MKCPGCNTLVRRYGPERCNRCQAKLDAEHAEDFKSQHHERRSVTGRFFYASVGEQLGLNLEACRGNTKPGKARKVDLERRGEQAIAELGEEAPKRSFSARLVYESMGGETLAVTLDRLTTAEATYIKQVSLRNQTPTREVTWPSQLRTPILRCDLDA